MRNRLAAGLTAALMTVGLLAGCSTQPDPASEFVDQQIASGEMQLQDLCETWNSSLLGTDGATMTKNTMIAMWEQENATTAEIPDEITGAQFWEALRPRIVEECGEPAAETASSPDESSVPFTESTPSAAAILLELKQGATIELEGHASNGKASAETPVEVSFDNLTCANTLPGYGLNQKSYEAEDAVADKGQQLCLVELEVKNTSKKPVFFSANMNTLRASDDNTYGEWDEPYSPGSIANDKGTEYSGDSDLINPGSIQNDYIIYSIPKGAAPTAMEFEAN